jgi:hypothetical protein
MIQRHDFLLNYKEIFIKIFNDEKGQISKYDLCISTNIFSRCQLHKNVVTFAARECIGMGTPRLLDGIVACTLQDMMSQKCHEAGLFSKVCSRVLRAQSARGG